MHNTQQPPAVEMAVTPDCCTKCQIFTDTNRIRALVLHLARHQAEMINDHKLKIEYPNLVSAAVLLYRQQCGAVVVVLAAACGA